MKEVVINACFGGFGLSHAAVMRYAELSGFKLYAFTADYVNGNRTTRPYIEDEEAFLVHYSRNPDPTQLENDPNSYFSDSRIERDDPILIQVVRELDEEAFGRCARLRIVEIPSGVDWKIEEYDGNEHIAERHRTWS